MIMYHINGSKHNMSNFEISSRPIKHREGKNLTYSQKGMSLRGINFCRYRSQQEDSLFEDVEEAHQTYFWEMIEKSINQTKLLR